MSQVDVCGNLAPLLRLVGYVVTINRIWYVRCW